MAPPFASDNALATYHASNAKAEAAAVLLHSTTVQEDRARLLRVAADALETMAVALPWLTSQDTSETAEGLMAAVRAYRAVANTELCCVPTSGDPEADVLWAELARTACRADRVVLLCQLGELAELKGLERAAAGLYNIAASEPAPAEAA